MAHHFLRAGKQRRWGAVIALWETYWNIKNFHWIWKTCAMFWLTDLLNFSISSHTEPGWVRVQNLPTLTLCLFIPSAPWKNPNVPGFCLMPDNLVEASIHNSKCLEAWDFSDRLSIPSFPRVIKHVSFSPTTASIIFCFVIKYLLSNRHRDLAVISVFLPLIMRSFEPIHNISQFRGEKWAWQLISSF